MYQNSGKINILPFFSGISFVGSTCQKSLIPDEPAYKKTNLWFPEPKTNKTKCYNAFLAASYETAAPYLLENYREYFINEREEPYDRVISMKNFREKFTYLQSFAAWLSVIKTKERQKIHGHQPSKEARTRHKKI